jgi:hypothetical protein
MRKKQEKARKAGKAGKVGKVGCEAEECWETIGRDKGSYTPTY